MSTEKPSFHLAFPAHDLSECKTFYEKLGAHAGRENPHALVLNLAGHQLVAHRVQAKLPEPKGIYPRHFGLIFSSLSDWNSCLNRAKEYELKFFREPVIRYENTPLEHRSFFLQDPTNNLLEFKYYTNTEAVFGEKTFKDVGEAISSP